MAKGLTWQAWSEKVNSTFGSCRRNGWLQRQDVSANSDFLLYKQNRQPNSQEKEDFPSTLDKEPRSPLDEELNFAEEWGTRCQKPPICSKGNEIVSWSQSQINNSLRRTTVANCHFLHNSFDALNTVQDDMEHGSYLPKVQSKLLIYSGDQEDISKGSTRASIRKNIKPIATFKTEDVQN